MSEGGGPPPIEPAGPFEGLRPTAILVGAMVDHFATLVSSLVLFALFQAGAGEQGADPAEQLETIARSAEFLVASLIVGTLCTVLGGYVGARRGGRLFVRHGAWVAVVSALIGLLLYAASDPAAHPNPLWFDLLGFGLLIPAGAVGGLLAGLRAP